MTFGSLADFLAMGGHALYVWLSYGAALLVVVYNVVSLRWARRRHIREATDQLRRGAGTGTADPQGAQQRQAGSS